MVIGHFKDTLESSTQETGSLASICEATTGVSILSRDWASPSGTPQQFPRASMRALGA